jgi:hypothetical protein
MARRSASFASNHASFAARTAAMRRRSAGMRRKDAGIRRADAGMRRKDAGIRRADAGMQRKDAGIRRADAGMRRKDAGLRCADTRMRRAGTGPRTRCNASAPSSHPPLAYSFAAFPLRARRRQPLGGVLVRLGRRCGRECVQREDVGCCGVPKPEREALHLPHVGLACRRNDRLNVTERGQLGRIRPARARRRRPWRAWIEPRRDGGSCARSRAARGSSATSRPHRPGGQISSRACSGSSPVAA